MFIAAFWDGDFSNATVAAAFEACGATVTTVRNQELGYDVHCEGDRASVLAELVAKFPAIAADMVK